MKNIVCYDVETTGLSVMNDKVIQLSAVKFNDKFEIIDKFDEYVRPIGEWHMAETAERVHGISTKFLIENGRFLKDVGPEFLAFIEGCDILSYNGNRFDIRMLCANLKEVGLEFNIEDRVFFDSFLLESKLESRKLCDVYKRYTGKELDGAHNALYDVLATVEVFKHQVAEFEKRNVTMEDIKEFDEIKLLCVDGMLRRGSNPNEPEEIVFARGKHKDMDVKQVFKQSPDYIKWIMENDGFDSYTKKIIREYIMK